MSRWISSYMPVFIHSCCSRAPMLGTTLVHEFHILFRYSVHTEWNLLSGICLCAVFTRNSNYSPCYIVPFLLFEPMVRWTPGDGWIVVLGRVGISSTASGRGDTGDWLAQAMLGIVDFFISCIFTIRNLNCIIPFHSFLTSCFLCRL